jgi:glycosyltransferase involved in cell wall biosynthesis
MQVSVVIPVYNTASYVRRAVESALAQPECGEVILIDDGSTDGSLDVCRELAHGSSQIRLLRHSDEQNHGAGPSRNLGIQSARLKYVAFLDADDFFLPNRFSVPSVLFVQHPDIDGVYEAVGVHFESASAEARWRALGGSSRLTTMVEQVPPERLFESQMPIGHSGYCPTGGWVVRRSIFRRTGLFECLTLHEDTVMYVKFAAVGRMVAGRLHEPVAMRGVHECNRASASRSVEEAYWHWARMWVALWRWGQRSLPRKRQQLLMARFAASTLNPFGDVQGARYWVQSGRQLRRLLSCYPRLIVQPLFWRGCLVAGLQRAGLAGG